MFSQNLSVNGEGHLKIGGVSTVFLAKKYGTPLYVMDEDVVRNNIRNFKTAADRDYGGNAKILYASKALCIGRMCSIAKEEGIGLDVVSAGELYTALRAGVSPKDIYYHGNNKTDFELEYALKNGVYHIVADNKEELLALSEIAQKLNVTATPLLRIKPGVDAHTHEFIKTGQIDSKFGFAIENGEAFEAVKYAISLKGIDFTGIHCHIGSQIFDIDPFILAADVMLSFAEKIKEELHAEVRELNLGGGFGIKYVDGDEFKAYGLYIEEVSKVVKRLCEEKKLLQPKILYEPGRAIVGAAGITLYTVGSVKEIKNIRTYVSVDGGMTDNPRFALYEAEYTMDIANKMNNPKETFVTVAGRCCESGDLLGKDIPLQKAEKGDILAVYSTGAYNYSMASNYNRTLRPAMVFIKEGEDILALKRETFEDLTKNDL